MLVIRDVTGAKQAEAALRHRAEMDHLISRISRQLIDQDASLAGCETSSLRVIEFALEAIANFIGAHRSAIFAYSEQQQQFDLVHEWNVAEAELVSSQISELTRSMSPWFYDQILTGQPIQIPCIANLSVEAATEKAWFEDRSTQSIVIVPMLHTGRIVGFLAADMIDRARTWSAETIRVLQRAGELIAIAQARYKAEEKFIKAFRASPSPIAITTISDQRFVDVNSSYLKLSGCSLEEIFNPTSNNLKIGVLQDAYNQAMQQALTEGSLQNQEVKFQTQSGDQRSVLLSIEPIDLSGTPCMLNIIHDITERKRLENELISLVSHELRTPMASLLGALELLSLEQFGHLTSKGQQVLNIATTNTKRLTRLVNDILDLERMRSGKVTLQKVKCNIAELLIQAAGAMQAMADGADVSLLTYAPTLELLIDPDRILQALTNLLNNAIKFSELRGKIWLTATQLGEHSVLIAIRDQGRGIPQDKLHVIFDRFTQVDASDSRSKGGTGLGLAICRNIIEQHDGKIWAESILGRGSTFYIVLPLLV